MNSVTYSEFPEVDYNDDICGICRNPLADSEEGELEGRRVTAHSGKTPGSLQCPIHEKCLDPWLKLGHQSCPLCRAPVEQPSLSLKERALQLMTSPDAKIGAAMSALGALPVLGIVGGAFVSSSLVDGTLSVAVGTLAGLAAGLATTSQMDIAFAGADLDVAHIAGAAGTFAAGVGAFTALALFQLEATSMQLCAAFLLGGASCGTVASVGMGMAMGPAIRNSVDVAIEDMAFDEDLYEEEDEELSDSENLGLHNDFYLNIEQWTHLDLNRG